MLTFPSYQVVCKYRGPTFFLINVFERKELDKKWDCVALTKLASKTTISLKIL